MRLTTRTDLAMRTLMYCAVNDGRTVRKTDIARACNASSNHLGLVIHLLAQAGVLTTTRGRNGGVRLARPADEISAGAVVRRFEAKMPFAECLAASGNTCPLASSCRLSRALCRALDAFYAALDQVSLADLVDENAGLHTLLLAPLSEPA